MDSDLEPDTNALFALLYAQLKSMAAGHMQGQSPEHTLQPTALVNEAYLKLCRRTASSWKDTGHFLATASRAMGQALVDHARAKKAAKRLPPGERVLLDEVTVLFESKAGDDLDGLDTRLAELRQRDPVMAEFVDLYFFGGQSFEVCAAVLGVPATTLRRDWKGLCAWLRIRL